jgi:hypothetical protein
MPISSELTPIWASKTPVSNSDANLNNCTNCNAEVPLLNIAESDALLLLNLPDI